MPSQILHVLHGRAVSALLGPGQLLDDASQPYFCLGCQGPDLFYHNQRTRPSAIEYGSLLHRRNYGDFSAALLSRAVAADSPPSVYAKGLAFAFGFVLHAFLDRALHPYIISRTGNGIAERDGFKSSSEVSTARLHMFLERIIDTAMLEELENINVSSWPQKFLLADPSAEGAEILVPLLSGALRAVFPERAGKDQRLDERLSNAFVDASYFYAVTTPGYTSTGSGIGEKIARLGHEKGLAATAYLHPEMVLAESDFCNFGHEVWLNPCEPGNPRSESVEDLYNDAVRDACSALEPFWNKEKMLDDSRLAAAIGNGNLSLSGDDGKRCQALHFSALELGKALENEYGKRKTQGF